MKPESLLREEVFELVEEARAQNKHKVNHVKSKLESRYPELIGKTIRRNGKSYNAIDYLLGDIGSYGTSSE